MRYLFILILSNVVFASAIDWGKVFLRSDQIVNAIREANSPNGEKWNDELRMGLIRHILKQKPNQSYLGILNAIAIRVEDPELSIEAQILAKTYWDKVYPTPRKMIDAIENGKIGKKLLWELNAYVQSKGDRAYAPVSEAIFQSHGLLQAARDSAKTLKRLRVKSLEDQMSRFRALLRGHARAKLSKGVVSIALEHIADPDAKDGDRWYLLHAIAPNFNREFGGLVSEFQAMFEAVVKQSEDSKVVGLAGILLSRAIAFSKKPERRARKKLRQVYSELSSKTGVRQRQLAALTVVADEDADTKAAVDVEFERLSNLKQTPTQNEKYFIENYVLSLPLEEARKILSHERLGPVAAPMIWERVRETVRSIDFTNPETLEKLNFVAQINRTPASNKDIKFKSETQDILLAIDPRSLVDAARESGTKELLRLARVSYDIRQRRNQSLEVFEDIFPDGKKRRLGKAAQPKKSVEPKPGDLAGNLALLRKTLPKRKKAKSMPNVKAESGGGEKSQMRAVWEKGSSSHFRSIFAKALKTASVPKDMLVVMSEVLHNATDDQTKQYAYQAAARYEDVDALPFLQKADELIDGAALGLRTALVEFLSSRYPKESGAITIATKTLKDTPTASLRKSLDYLDNFDFSVLDQTDRMVVLGHLSQKAGELKRGGPTGDRFAEIIRRVENAAPGACNVEGLVNGKKTAD